MEAARCLGALSYTIGTLCYKPHKPQAYPRIFLKKLTKKNSRRAIRLLL
jgi:hypothetical protein